jgi:hypothetical protein
MGPVNFELFQISKIHSNMTLSKRDLTEFEFF